MKKVSVVVPCYNAAKYLDKCVGYLLRQTIGLEDMEIILVDDASTDGGETRNCILGYEQLFPDTVIAVFLEQNLRQGGARNAGVSYASGEYLLFCDADDWILEETLEHCYNAARKYDADIVGFGRQTVDRHEACAVLKKGGQDFFAELDTEDKKKRFLFEMGNDSYSSQNKLFRLSLIRGRQIAFVEHLFIEEFSFTVPARLYAERFYFLDEQLYVYYMSPGSTMRGDWEKKKWDNLKGWILLMEDLENRGLLARFPKELEYLFFELGFGTSLQMLYQAGCAMDLEEWNMVAQAIRMRAPNIRRNPYLDQEQVPLTRAWNGMLLALLDMPASEESVKEANRLLAGSIGKLF